MFKPFNTQQPLLTKNVGSPPKFYTGIITVITQNNSGDIFIGGSFTDYRKKGRDRFVKLNSEGKVYTDYNDNASGDSKFSNQIKSIVIQPDNKVLVGGAFTNYAGTISRSYLVRLNSDGTLDTTFCTNATDGTKFNNLVYSTAVQSDGKVLVGGAFTNYAGTTGRSYLVRLNSDGTLDTSFCANATDGNKFNNSVNSIAIQSDGKILLGGAFGNYGGTANRNHLIRLNSDGTLDTSFCANATDGAKFSSSVLSAAVQPNGGILVSGYFTNYGGTPYRNYFIRLNSSGIVDGPFCSNASDSNPFLGLTRFTGAPLLVVSQSDNKILLGGDFTDYSGYIGSNCFIRLLADGQLDSTFSTAVSSPAKFNNSVYSIAIQSDGKVLVGGAFTNYAGTTGRSRLIRLNSGGSLDSSFCEIAVDSLKLSGTLCDFSIQSDNKLVIGGSFTNYGGTTNRNRLIRVRESGQLDTTFCTNATDGNKFNNIVFSTIVQPDGKILVSGSFTNYGGTTGRSYLVRLNSDGTLDTTFCTNATDGTKFNNSVYPIAIQSDGKVLVGGIFTNYGGTTNRNRLVRLNSDGTLDTSFCANATDGAKFNNSVFSVNVQPDGKILVGGSFTGYGGTTNRNRLVRLNSDGTLDTSFCANATDGAKFNNEVYSTAVQSDGKVLVGGPFTSYGGTANRSSLVRLNSDGTLDSNFCANATDGAKFNGQVSSIAIRSDNKILICGGFMNYSGNTGSNYFICLNENGTYNPNSTNIAAFAAFPLTTKVKTKNNNTFIPGLTSSGYFTFCDSIFNII